MELGIVAKFRPANRLFDLVHQSLVFGAVFFKVGKSVPAQEALFATEVHVCELDQPSHLLIEPRAAVSTRQLMPKRVERIQENPMLVIHRLNADGSLKLCGSTCHSSSLFDYIILYRARYGQQYRFCGVALRPWSHNGAKELFQNYFGIDFISAGRQDNGGS